MGHGKDTRKDTTKPSASKDYDDRYSSTRESELPTDYEEPKGLTRSEHNRVKRQMRAFIEYSGMLYKKVTRGEPKRVVQSTKDRLKVLEEFHEVIIRGHLTN